MCNGICTYISLQPAARLRYDPTQKPQDMMSALARSSAVLLLLALLAGAGGASSVCDTANCGRGDCAEVPGGLPPNYECHCDPGWSHAFKLVPFSPCIVPDCSFHGACLNLSLTPPTGIPKDVCAVVNCGPGGACKAGGGAAVFSYSCECRPGYANLLSLTALPCVSNCLFGSDCYALGLGRPAPPAVATPGDHGSPGASAPPSGTTGNATANSSLGSVSLPSQLQLLLLVLVATLHGV